jgi:hypothetical protein
VLPDYETRRETLDFLRIDLEKLRGERDIVCLLEMKCDCDVRLNIILNSSKRYELH